MVKVSLFLQEDKSLLQMSNKKDHLKISKEEEVLMAMRSKSHQLLIHSSKGSKMKLLEITLPKDKIVSQASFPILINHASATILKSKIAWRTSNNYGTAATRFEKKSAKENMVKFT